MKQLERAILDLNRRHDKSYSWCGGDYLRALDKLRAMQIEENDHEQKLAQIQASLPPKKTMADVMDRLLNWLINNQTEGNEPDECNGND